MGSEPLTGGVQISFQYILVYKYYETNFYERYFNVTRLIGKTVRVYFIVGVHVWGGVDDERTPLQHPVDIRE